MSRAIFRTATNREAPALFAGGDECRITSPGALNPTPHVGRPLPGGPVTRLLWAPCSRSHVLVEKLIVAEVGERQQRWQAGDRPPGLRHGLGNGKQVNLWLGLCTFQAVEETPFRFRLL
jgi:hypothetical protein